MFCPKCGAQMNDGASFCPKCGSSTNSDNGINIQQKHKIVLKKQSGYNQNGYNPNGYNQNGYNPNGYNQNGYNPNGYNQTYLYARIPNHMVGAILTTIFCCLIGGIIAIVYSSQVNTKIALGDIRGAQEASKNAQTWITINIVVGIIGFILNVIFDLLPIFMY